ncbi:MAG TPA: four helix bundle protein [Candidatus Moranbacteria bacterium]|nr:four helix bundle protein [Candidatus Moranbacteria bacterium]HBT45296.1 four helix bundle protein [Candidatus Moranbacteria bacterium]
MKIQKFEELNIWKDSLRITKVIYDYTSEKDFARDFGLRDQIRRAIVSVSSNIVEGFEKNNNNEFARFLRIAKGSAGEVRNQLHIAFAIKYITEFEFEKTNKELEILSAQIGKFIAYLVEKKQNKEFIKK